MTPLQYIGFITLGCVGFISQGSAQSSAQVRPQTAEPAKTVLVELFTSEGCSSCPPADALLRQVNGMKSAEGMLIVGLSEHVSYWNGLGWKDPYSSEQYTARQNEYGTRLGLPDVYTPQMIVNGREQFVGSDRSALESALRAEAGKPQIPLRIGTAQVAEGKVTFTYSAAQVPAGTQLIAVLADDVDKSQVLRGENSGRALVHASVARAFAPLGKLTATEAKTVSLPLPDSYVAGVGHHLVLFAQGEGGVVAVDSHAW